MPAADRWTATANCSTSPDPTAVQAPRSAPAAPPPAHAATHSPPSDPQTRRGSPRSITTRPTSKCLLKPSDPLNRYGSRAWARVRAVARESESQLDARGRRAAQASVQSADRHIPQLAPRHRLLSRNPLPMPSPPMWIRYPPQQPGGDRRAERDTRRWLVTANEVRLPPVRHGSGVAPTGVDGQPAWTDRSW